MLVIISVVPAATSTTIILIYGDHSENFMELQIRTHEISQIRPAVILYIGQVEVIVTQWGPRAASFRSIKFVAKCT